MISQGEGVSVLGAGAGTTLFARLVRASKLLPKDSQNGPPLDIPRRFFNRNGPFGPGRALEASHRNYCPKWSRLFFSQNVFIDWF